MIFEEIIYSVRQYPRAWKFIKAQGLWWIFVIPFFLAILLFLLFVWGGNEMVDNMWLFLAAYFPDKASSGFMKFLEGLFHIVVKLLLLLFYLKINRYFLLILLSPFFSYVSEVVQSRMTGKKKKNSLKIVFSDAIRGVRIAGRNLFLELSFSLLIFVASFIFPFGFPIYSILLLGVESYFWGFSMLDLRNEFHSVPVKDSLEEVKKHPGLAIGNGLPMILGLLVPVLGITFMPMFALVAGAFSANDRFLFR
ncbi:EI24 domain-containing protein [Persicobacter diffluens]|uniref:EI24 domain-containing protein n=1 Tax=Persicobacter diffluens TaxID=981 RepID=A0AAN4VUY3_9BACT|nr:hypothetical protein PEDI_09780 [Persicobacter diffluens]